MSKFKMILPPKKEQKEIISYIDSENQKFDNTVSKIQKEIELLKEYRQALIFKAVTGKNDVTG